VFSIISGLSLKIELSLTSKISLFLININSTETVKDILNALKKLDKGTFMKKYVDTFRYGKEVYEM